VTVLCLGPFDSTSSILLGVIDVDCVMLACVAYCTAEEVVKLIFVLLAP